MSPRELAILGVGALTGGIVGTSVGMVNARPVIENPNPHKHPYRIKEEEPEGEFSFTYYLVSAKGAFNHVATRQIEALRAKGFKVDVRDFFDHLRFFKHKPEHKNDFAVVHPLFHADRRALDYLDKCHRYIVSFEVADTTMIGRDYVQFGNDDRIDMLCLPSTFSVESYRRSGVMNRLWLVPHGVDELYGKPQHEFDTDKPILKKIREDERIKVLCLATHSEYRKGWDISLRVVKELLRRGRKIVVVYKSYPPCGGAVVHDLHANAIPNYAIIDWISEEEMIYLYDSCDVLLHPYRSGGFELNPFEAMARGLPVVTTGWGSVLDFANVHNSYLVSPKGLVKVFPSGLLGHVGMGADPDVGHAIELTDWVIGNLDYSKKRARRQKGEFVARSWDKVVDEFLKGCREVWT